MDLAHRNYGSRYITAPQRDDTGVYKFGLILWIASTYWYKKQRFAHDKNLSNLLMFSFGSFFSSTAISRFFFESPHTAAIRRNNLHELRHQKKLGLI